MIKHSKLKGLFLALTLTLQIQALRAHLGAGFLLRSLKRAKIQCQFRFLWYYKQKTSEGLWQAFRELVESVRQIHCSTLTAVLIVLTLCKASGGGL